VTLPTRLAVPSAGRGRALYLAALVVLSILGVAFLYQLFRIGTRHGDWGFDALAYWSFDPSHPYFGQFGSTGHLGGMQFNYAPPAALLFIPTHSLPFEVFRAGWFGLQFAALVWLCRRYALAALLFIPVAAELFNGNLHLLLGAAIVLGFRYPAAWSLVLLTKVTPGIGLLWFAVRKEWRNLAVALGATAAISAASLVVVPHMWSQWVEWLLTAPSTEAGVLWVPIPLSVRLLAAALLVTYGAQTDRRWTVPVASMLALPALWFNGLSMMVAVLPLWGTLPTKEPSGGEPATKTIPAADSAPARG